MSHPNLDNKVTWLMGHKASEPPKGARSMGAGKIRSEGGRRGKKKLTNITTCAGCKREKWRLNR